MKRVLEIFFILSFFLFSFAQAKTQQEEYQNDFLYSQEYFDYLIECASIADFEMKEEARKKQKETDEIDLNEPNQDESVALDEIEPIKLKIETFDVSSYKESVKKEDTKTIINVSDKFSFVGDVTTFKNKYSTNDYRLITGAEYSPFKKLTFASGLETNYRGEDQNPISKKLYITPTLKFNDKFSISFYNKFDTISSSTDHDISFNFSPFKSKAADFRIYAGITNENDGSTSESVNFSTNFYFF